MAQAEGVAAAVSSFPKPAYASPASPCMENMLRGQPQRGDMEAWDEGSDTEVGLGAAGGQVYYRSLAPCGASIQPGPRG